MNSRFWLTSIFSAWLVMAQTVAWADPVVFFDTIPDGRTDFDGRVTGANGTVNTDTLSGLASGNSWARADYTITSTNNAVRSINAGVLNPAPLGLDGGDAINMSADGSVTSGLTFTFNSPINAFALDLEDWATCCHPSALYIVFDGGTPILIGSANSRNDNPGYAAGQGDTTFIGSIDDSDTFTTITFYGTGSGDALYAGGIIRYATVAIGSLSGYASTVNDGAMGELATYLDANDNSGDLATVATYLNTKSEAQVKQALKKIFPVNTSVNNQTGMANSQQTADVLIEKVGTVLGDFSSSPMNLRSAMFDTSDGDSLAAALPTVPTMSFRGGWQADAYNATLGNGMDYLTSQPYTEFTVGNSALWFQGVTAFTDGKETEDSIAYESASRGLVLGYEYALDPTTLVGFISGIYNSDIDAANNTANTESNQYSFGLYGQKIVQEKTKLTGMISAAYGDYSSERIVSVGGINGIPEAEYDSYSLSATVGASRLYTHCHYQIEPALQLNYIQVHTSAYDEKNGGVYNMHINADNFSKVSAKLSVGVKVDNVLENAGDKKLGFLVKPYIAQHVQVAKAGNSTYLVSGNSGQTVVDGRSLTKFETGLGAEATYSVKDARNIKLGVNYAHNRFDDSYLGYVGYGIKF